MTRSHATPPTGPAGASAPSTPYAKVQGRCPACGGESLFLGDGGYVTCSRLDCASPDAATTLLEKRPARDQPASPPRLSINELSSDQLDALYDRVETAEVDLDLVRDAAALRRKGLLSDAELYAVIGPPPTVNLSAQPEQPTAPAPLPEYISCPTCGPTALEPHPRLPLQRCSNCKEHLPAAAP